MNGLVRRLIQLYIGLILYGMSCALMVRGRLGLDPWDVFHQGVSRRIGWSIGTVVIVAGVLVLLCWIPLRQLPGVGTLSNVVLVGLSIDGALRVLPTPGRLPCESVISPVASCSAVSRPAFTSARASGPVRGTGS